MFNRFCFKAGLLLLASWAAMSLPASAADDDSYVESLNLTIQPQSAIQVTIRDDDNGDPDDHAISEDITFDADIDIDLNYPGALDAFVIQWGSCAYAEVCKLRPVMHSSQQSERDLKRTRTFTFPVESMDFGAGLALDDPHSPLYRACRERGGNGQPVQHRAFVTLAVETSRDTGFDDLVEGGGPDIFHLANYSEMQTFPVDLNIDCTFLPTVSAPPEAKSVDLRVKQIGDRCPKQVEVSAFIDYEEQTEARFHFLHNGTRSEEIAIQPRRVTLGNKSWWRVERMQRYTLNPGQHRFRVAVVGGPKSKIKTIKVDCEPFRVDSTWLSYKVENGAACPKQVVETVKFTTNRPGKITYQIKHEGGLIVHTGTAKAKRDGNSYTAMAKRTFETGAFDAQLMAQVKNNTGQNSGWTQLQVKCLKVLGGKITLRDEGSSCPRESGVAISFRADQAGKIPYQLDCTGGRTWKRKATAKQTDANTFIAVAVLPLKIEKNEHINCALKTRFNGKLETVDLRGRDYSCIKPSVETGGSGLVNPSRPTHSDNERPPKLVADPPRIVCRGGDVRGNRCVCAKAERRVKLGARSWRCVKKRVEVVCKGGKIRGERCACSANTRKVKIGNNAWQCKKKVAKLRCIGGKARGRKCVCSRNMKAKRIGAAAYRCVGKPAAKRSCPRGKVRIRGKCIRPAG